MHLDRILPFSHELMKKFVSTGDIAIDATCGNGHDTLFLARLVGETGHVYGFDIQKEAIDATGKRIDREEMGDRTTLHEDSHANALNYIPAEDHKRIKGAIFNLGFLPGSDKTVITTPDQTITAIDQMLAVMPTGSIIVLVVYHGHSGGEEEKNRVIEYASYLDQKLVHVLRYQFINQKNNAPFILALEKA
ncbi:class I SAM-dependent methyltransferase [Salimicrobium sp. PL1-032A]|uniref:class I SAM-dependent methyltransferase n=1 Tax=Salimicrobium sp. PL1-032A TaxID=3095364 RepID=UPI003260ED6A